MPAARINNAPVTAAILIFCQAIIFSVPFTRVAVEILAIAPFAIARAVTGFSSVTGAAWTELEEITPAMIAVVELTPRAGKKTV